MSYNIGPYHGNNGNTFGHHFVPQSQNFSNQQIALDGPNSSFGHYSSQQQQQATAKSSFSNTVITSSAINSAAFTEANSQSSSPRETYGYKMTTASNNSSHANNYNYTSPQQNYGHAYNYSSDNIGNFNGSFNANLQTWNSQSQPTTTPSNSLAAQPITLQQYQQQQFMQPQHFVMYQQMAQMGLMNTQPQKQYKSSVGAVGTKPHRENSQQGNPNHQDSNNKSDGGTGVGNWSSLPSNSTFDSTTQSNASHNGKEGRGMQQQQNDPYSQNYPIGSGTGTAHTSGFNHKPPMSNINMPPTTSATSHLVQGMMGSGYNRTQRHDFSNSAPYNNQNPMFNSSMTQPQGRDGNNRNTDNASSTAMIGAPRHTDHGKPPQQPPPPSFTAGQRNDFPAHQQNFPFTQMQHNQFPLQIINNFQNMQNRSNPTSIDRTRSQAPATNNNISNPPNAQSQFKAPMNFYNGPPVPAKTETEIPPFPEAWQSREMGDTSEIKQQWPQQLWMQQGHNNGSPMHHHDIWAGGGQDWNHRFPQNNWRGQSRFGMPPSPQQNQMQAPMYSSSSRQGRGQTRTNRSLWTPSGKKSASSEDEKGESKSDKESGDAGKIKSDVANVSQSEIKAFLYAWLGKSHLKPTYDIETVGQKPSESFKCKLTADNYTFVGLGSAGNKKDAQSMAAWSFVEYLVKEGQLSEDDLPPKNVPQAKQQQPSESRSDETSATANMDETTPNKNNKTTDAGKESKTTPSANQRKDAKKQSQKTNWSGDNKHTMAPHNWRPGRSPEFMPRGRGRMMNHHPMELIPPIMGMGPSMFPPMGMPMPRMMRPPGPMMQPGWGDMDPHHGGWWHPMHEWGPMPPRPFMRGRPPSPHMHNQNDFWMLRDMEERRHMEAQEWQHPEDMFIQKMILTQRQAEGIHKDPKSMEWMHSKIRPITTSDDRHVMMKHESIIPKMRQIDRIVEVTKIVEQTLKLLSDRFVEEDAPKIKQKPDEEKPANNDDDTTEKTDDKAENNDSDKESKNKIKILKRPEKSGSHIEDQSRVLCGVTRVGALAQNLLISSDNSVQLILLCRDIPTKSLLDRIMEPLSDLLNESSKPSNHLTVISRPDDAGFVVQTSDKPQYKVVVTLTSQALETDIEESKDKNKDNKETNNEKQTDEKSEKVKSPVKELDRDLLPVDKMNKSLSFLSHDDWFRNKAHRVPTYQLSAIITRILRDLQMNHGMWKGIELWPLNILIFNFLVSSKEQMSPGDALRRAFEVMAGGILLPGMPGIKDPCAKDRVDVLRDLSEQDRVDITRQSQHCLRLIAFREIHKVLKISKMSSGFAKSPVTEKPTAAASGLQESVKENKEIKPTEESKSPCVTEGETPLEGISQAGESRSESTTEILPSEIVKKLDVNEPDVPGTEQKCETEITNEKQDPIRETINDKTAEEPVEKQSVDAAEESTKIHPQDGAQELAPGQKVCDEEGSSSNNGDS